jgi:hypothetical protein
MKIKPKDHHFDTDEAIKAESEAMLNTLREHDFQEALKKKKQKRWERCISADWDCLEGDSSQ